MDFFKEFQKVINIVKLKVLHSNINFKILLTSIVLSLLTTFTFLYFNDSLEQDLQQNVIRLHIRGRSNSDIDQNFKLYVRDKVLKHINTVNKNGSKESVEQYIVNNLDELELYVNNLIKDANFNYNSSISFGLEKFPVKQYGFITLPSGTYTSLTINLDKGKGNNWWCVVYPPLCYVESDTMTFDDESVETLKEILDESTFNEITSKNGNINLDFKILQLLDKYF